MKTSTFLGLGFWASVSALILEIAIKDKPGVVTFSAISVIFLGLYIYSKQKVTTKERFH